MADIVQFPGTPTDGLVPADWTPEKVIEALEELLVKARAGRIVSLAAAWVLRDGCTDGIISTTGTRHRHHLTASTLYLLRAVEEKAGEY